MIAFILRQLGRFDSSTLTGPDDKDVSTFRPGQPREKWIKKRTSVKLKNVTANHRANDVIAREGEVQRLSGRFMYGPLDMITLAGERIDIHVMKEPPGGEWVLLATEITDKSGRIMYSVPPDRALGYGIYPIKMVVRGDHTSVDFYLAVIPSRTECVVFSIDGSFTASMSVTGRDPKGEFPSNTNFFSTHLISRPFNTLCTPFKSKQYVPGQLMFVAIGRNWAIC